MPERRQEYLAPLPTDAGDWSVATSAQAIRQTLAEGRVPAGLPSELAVALGEVLERIGAGRPARAPAPGPGRRAYDRSPEKADEIVGGEVLQGLRDLKDARIGPSLRQAEGVGLMTRIAAALDRAAHSLGVRFATLGLQVERASSTAEEFDALAADLKQRSATQIDSIQAITFNLGSVAESLEQSAAATAGSLEVAANSRTATENMFSGVDEITRAIEEIKVATDRNLEFVRTIERIALGTEMLAINASIEAARAGSSSKGFKVIADEVRRLATETKATAKSIGTTTQTSLAAVENGVVVVSRTHDLIGVARNAIDGVTESIGRMRDGTVEQSGKVSALLESIVGITAFAVDNARLAASSAELGQRQREEVAELQDLIADVAVHASIIAEASAQQLAATRTSPGEAQASPAPSVELF